MRHLAAITVFLFLGSAAALDCAVAGEVFFLNASDGSRYTIMRYEGALAVPPVPVIGSSNDGGAMHTAWPSAFKLPSGTTRIYASRYFNGWNDIAVWEATDGLTFSLRGTILTANASEPSGIGPAQVYYDAAAPAPWKMLYAVRNASGTGSKIDLADSTNGLAWTRRGTVLSVTEPFENAGVSPSWVERAIDGTWILFYHTYISLTQGAAAIATAASSGGPFSTKQLIFQPNAIAYTLTNAKQLATTGIVSGTVRLNEPHLIRHMADGGSQIVLPIKQVGTTVYFDAALLADFSTGSTELVHIASNKVDPSYARQFSDGSWRGIFTGYGHWLGVMTEYTFKVEAPTLAGPWTASKGPVAFSPWNLATLKSAENPTPLVPIGVR